MSGACDVRQVLVLVNRRAGVFWSFDAMRRAMDRCWDVAGTDLAYQFCHSPSDGMTKARRALERGVDVLMVVGGDGTVNSVGRVLVGADAVLGVIPTGSGNGFARHFGIPLTPERAVESLARGRVQTIDVGVVEGRPFFVTCSMAWDAEIARAFERSPVRGILPYIFAGVQGFLGYRPQPAEVEIDSRERLQFNDPLVLTIANLSQYGGGARIAPHARADDGFLELVVARRQDAARLVANIGRLFDGSIVRMPEVIYRRFRSLVVRRRKAAEIQVDGERVKADSVVRVQVVPSALKVLVPDPPPAPDGSP